MDPAPPARRYGQNFLANPSLAAWLVDRFAPREDDVVVEIGPGRGALTLELAPRCGRLVALEIDERLIGPLRDALAAWPYAEVRRADALDVDWDALGRELGARLRVIGNLPYNVGTAIVGRLLATDAVRDAQFVLQREVVDRLVAGPGSRRYGPLSVLVALRTRARRLRTIAPGSFRPRPRVDSAVIALSFEPDAPLPAAEVPWLRSWLHRGFARRRRTLAGNLADRREQVRGFLAERGLPPDLRAEALPPADWLDLARRLEAVTPPDPDRAGTENGAT
ncbi:MAG: 16S rRNA (adenine(1518)-N(6)/adenine(1519)-N(6)) -dimethyltransferase RsmA [Acidobacteriota bacterium]